MEQVRGSRAAPVVLVSLLLLVRTECYLLDPEWGGIPLLASLLEQKVSPKEVPQGQTSPAQSGSESTPVQVQAKVTSAAGSSKMVILMPVSESTIEQAGELLMTLDRQGHSDKVLFATLDDVAYSMFGRLFPQKTLTPQSLGVTTVLHSAEMKPLLVRALLELNVAVVCIDPMHVWRMDPLPVFTPDYDAWLLRDYPETESRAFNPERELLGASTRPGVLSTLLYVRPTEGGKMLVGGWLRNVRGVAGWRLFTRMSKEVSEREELNRAVVQLSQSKVSFGVIPNSVAKDHERRGFEIKALPLRINPVASHSKNGVSAM